MQKYLVRARLALIVCAIAVAGMAGTAEAQVNNAARLRALSDASDAADAGNFARAAALLEPFAKDDDPIVLNMMGDLYATGGKDFPKDAVKAFELHQKAATKGNPAAMRHVAMAYERGNGVAGDTAKGQEWWLRAANKGDSRAQATVGKRFANGENGVKQDYVQAWKWLTLSNNGAAATYEKAAREEATKLKNDIQAKMSQTQVNDAQKAVREWAPQ